MCLCFCRWHIPDWLEQTAVVEPIHPFERGKFDCLEVSPRTTPVNDLSFIEAIDGLCQGVVIAVTDTPHRRFDTGFSEAFRLANGQILRATIAVVNQPHCLRGAPIMDSLFQSIEHKARMGRCADTPADDLSGISINDEGDICEPLPCGEWSKKRRGASPPRTVRAPFSAYGSLFNLGPWPWQRHDNLT